MQNFWRNLNKERFIKTIFLYLIAFQGGLGIVGPLITKSYALKQIIISAIIILVIFIIFEDNVWIASFFYLLLGIGVYVLSRNRGYIEDVSIGMSLPGVFYSLFKYIAFDTHQNNTPLNLDIYTSFKKK
ncbi:MAG: hypothetical protein ACRC41_14105 [Sarcina sp.]